MTISEHILFILVAAFAAGTALAEDHHIQGNSAVAIVATQPVAGVASKTQISRPDNDKGMESLNLMGLDGVKHSLDDWKGKVVVINFWATWCSPCLYEIRDLVAYQEQYKSQGLQIIGVGLDEERKLRNVQRTLDINYPVLLANMKKSENLLNNWGNKSGTVPYSVVIDRDGRVAYTHHGMIDNDIFNEVILPLLDKV